jgi:uncharacterized OB-fold protein
MDPLITLIKCPICGKYLDPYDPYCYDCEKEVKDDN